MRSEERVSPLHNFSVHDEGNTWQSCLAVNVTRAHHVGCVGFKCFAMIAPVKVKTRWVSNKFCRESQRLRHSTHEPSSREPPCNAQVQAGIPLSPLCVCPLSIRQSQYSTVIITVT